MNENFTRPREMPQWISVKDKLPKADGVRCIDCIVTVRETRTMIPSYIGNDVCSIRLVLPALFDPEQKIWNIRFDDELHLNALLDNEGQLDGYHVTHWMPFPKPPKED